MFKINICRVCLGDNTILYCVTNTNYQEMFEKLTKTKLDDGLPKTLCYICYSQFEKCIKFAKRAIKSYKILSRCSRRGTVITKSDLSRTESSHTLKRTPVKVLSIESERGPVDELDVKPDVNHTEDVQGKIGTIIEEFSDVKVVSDAPFIDITKPIHTNDLLINYQLNDKPSNDTSIPNQTPSLLRHLLINKSNSVNDRVEDDKLSKDDKSIDNTDNKSLKVEVTDLNTLNDGVSNDKSLNDTTKIKYDSPSLPNLLLSNDKSTNDTINIDNSLNDTSNTNEKSTSINNLILLNDISINNKGLIGIQLTNDDELSGNLFNDDFSSADDEILSSLKPISQTKGRFNKEQYKKLNVSVVKLGTEQQRHDVSARRLSENYRHSEYRCERCYRGFGSANTLAKHMDKHSEDKSGKFECDICHFRYRTISKLRSHIENTHSRFYKCNVCDTMLHSIFQAKVHNREHEGFKYTCKLCSREFSKRTSYLSHLRIKHASKHICKLCGKSFVSAMGLMQHVSKGHKGEITRQESDTDCRECDLKFVSMDALYRHRLHSQRHKADWTHSTMCFVCHEDLKNKVILKKHLKDHRDKLFYNYSGENASKDIILWKCEECPKMFKQKSNLRGHVKRKHTDTKLSGHRSEEFICEICGLKLKSVGSLTAHRRIHTGERPHACASCPKSFPSRSQLTLHSRTHSGHRPYRCADCAKTFTQKTALNRHTRTHTGAKPYACPVCTKRFSQSNSLKNHVATVHYKLPSYKQRAKAKNTTEQQYLQQ